MKDPKGRTVIGFEKHIFVCENRREKNNPRGCCAEKEGSQIRLLFKTEIAKEGLSKKIRTNKAGCLDFCEQGPTIVIYPEGVWYQIKNPEKDIKEIVKEHLIKGNIVSRCQIKL